MKSGRKQSTAKSSETTQNRSTARVSVRYASPDAIKIKGTGEVSHIYILKQIKAASILAPLGQRVTRIR